MTDLLPRFEQFVGSSEHWPHQMQKIFHEALAALKDGSGSLPLAFELELMAKSWRGGTESLLREVAEALRRDAFNGPNGAGYLPKGKR
jgi:hypothetical protein